jgi:hypothetical protein
LGYRLPQQRKILFRVPAEKMVIDKVVVNPKLDPSLFAKAGIEPASNAE